jgi:hypothetical protein
MNIRKTSSTFAATLGIGFGLCVATSIARAAPGQRGGNTKICRASNKENIC